MLKHLLRVGLLAVVLTGIATASAGPTRPDLPRVRHAAASDGTGHLRSRASGPARGRDCPSRPAVMVAALAAPGRALDRPTPSATCWTATLVGRSR